MLEGQPLRPLGVSLLVLGIVFVAAGLLLLFGDRWPWLGRLPGDIAIRGERWTLFVPITTMLLVSLALTLLVNLLLRR